VANRLRAIPEIEDLQYGEEWVDRFSAVVQLARWGAGVIGGTLGVAVILIILNTIRLTLYARREEIEIMKLVGASNWFVKVPFLLEGMLQGVLGSSLAVGLLALGYLVMRGRR
jgi:cell division transport system permease protein